MIRQIDPEGVSDRTNARDRTMGRREYSVKHSNSIWHIDANLKLIRLIQNTIRSYF